MPMQSYQEKIAEKYIDSISDITDLTAEDKPAIIFYFLTCCFGYLLRNDEEKTVSEFGVKMRKRLNFIIKNFGNKFLSSPQYIENRNWLKNTEDTKTDTEILLPDVPVIWCANHAFKDDTLASVLAIKRHAYIRFI